MQKKITVTVEELADLAAKIRRQEVQRLSRKGQLDEDWSLERKKRAAIAALRKRLSTESTQKPEQEPE